MRNGSHRTYSKMPDLKSFWNKKHNQGKVDHYTDHPSSFAVEVNKLLKPNSKILDIGCGVANDSIYFAKNGHLVLASDISEVAINKNKKRFGESANLTFSIIDIAEPLNIKDNEFDMVYARLSLHYFTDKATKQIFKEIHRILKPKGLLCFICKSIADPEYGIGKKIENNMYEENGHTRHFFSEDYVRECLKDSFTIKKLENGKEKFYKENSAFVKVVAETSK